MSGGRNFDDLITRFTQNIYAHPKGKIRLAIVQSDLEDNIPQLSQPGSLKVLDAGAGSGQMMRYFAQKGHTVVACDISKNMLRESERLVAETVPNADVTFIHQAFQQLPHEMWGQFDIVICHAVLEWVDEPIEAIESLLTYLKPGGRLSLMFYNVNAIILRNLLKGNFRKVQSGDYRGHPNGLTPNHPLDPGFVLNALKARQVQVDLYSGVRIVYDYLSADMREQRSLEDILEMEKRFSRHDPFRAMGRYVHLLCTSGTTT